MSFSSHDVIGHTCDVISYFEIFLTRHSRPLTRWFTFWIIESKSGNVELEISQSTIWRHKDFPFVCFCIRGKPCSMSISCKLSREFDGTRLNKGTAFRTKELLKLGTGKTGFYSLSFTTCLWTNAAPLFFSLLWKHSHAVLLIFIYLDVEIVVNEIFSFR